SATKQPCPRSAQRSIGDVQTAQSYLTRSATPIGPDRATTEDWFFVLFSYPKKKAPDVSAKCLICLPNLVGAIGLEPTTPTMSRWCSNQLSYAPAKPQIIAVFRRLTYGAPIERRRCVRQVPAHGPGGLRPAPRS